MLNDTPFLVYRIGLSTRFFLQFHQEVIIPMPLSFWKTTGYDEDEDD